MSKISVLFILVMLYFNSLYSQVAINSDGAAPDASSGLDVNYTNRGVLIPRMTMGQRDAIPSAADGLMVFCTNCGSEGSLSIHSNGTWKTFSSCSCIAPTSDENHVLAPGQITWTWKSVENVSGYKWNTVNDYNTAEDTGSDTSSVESGLSCDTVYNRYIWAYNSCSASSGTLLTQAISGIYPDSPSEGTHLHDEFQITWNWTTVNGVIGYKLNTINDINSAIDMGLSTTFEETGLSCGTSFTRYVWSFNDCGYSAVTALNFATSPCFVCGNVLNIVHTPDSVAPVSKTTTYHTVNNIPGAPSKCWITSNLGSDHQATSVSDNTEASAGWYWQFNREQGFMHDGSSRTPNTTWITPINEDMDWTSANDPCSLELGTGWRMPTGNEWSAVDATGGWTTWSGPWNSNLKIHAAGKLTTSTGALSLRGTQGMYWSTTQNLSYNNAQALFLFSSSCDVSMQTKSYGATIRCLKD
ncbi:MAG: hypothetical protein HGA23_01110 [Bacteroidales bacterium]|nr:hypothetical protein [Bacteroidales bacterium]